MNVIAMQRAVAVRRIGIEARDLYREGYGVDADRLLDALNELRETWSDGQDRRYPADSVVAIQEHKNFGCSGGTLRHAIAGRDVIL